MKKYSTPQKVIRLLLVILALLLATLFYMAVCGGRMDGDGSQQTRTISDIRNIFSGLREFQTSYHVMPTGTPLQVYSALTGNNPKGIVLYQSTPGREMKDYWGNEFTLSFSSNHTVEISSSGKNAIWGDEDDIVISEMLK
jgi:hypothetical protein